MQLKIERMNHTGDGIAIKENIIYFVPKTIIGDIIEVEPNNIEKHKNYNKINKYNLIEKSSLREEIKCPYYQKCGGCQLMGLNYKEQLNYKLEKVKNIFKKYANLEINPDIIGTSQYNYRNKITLQVKNKEIGLYSENTNELIPIEKCLLINNNLNKIIPLLKKINLSKIDKIVLKTMQNKIMIQLLGTPNQQEVLNILSKEVDSIYINDNLIKGMPYLKEKLDRYEYCVSPNSFFQVNHQGTLEIYNKIKEYLGKGKREVLDLYCGTGTIGIYVSNNCENIIGIEINSSSIKDAKENIKLNNIKNMHVLKGDVGTLLKNDKEYDAIIVDPPRSGLDKKTTETLLKIKTPNIIYVSCNPMTLARDINNLKEYYTLDKITLVDMFPNTYHIESLMVLERKN